MTTATASREPFLDWYRIGAWSGSFAAHVAILLLVALPMATPVMRPPQTTVVARWIETEPPPPAIPEPPPPIVPHRMHATPTHTPPPVAPVQTNATFAATEPTIATAPTPDTASAPTSDANTRSSDIGTGRATQTLAYAMPLQPRYPPDALRAHEQGMVVLRVLVDEAGNPRHVEIARSSGHARLDAAARESVMHARFRPVMRDGAAISTWGLVPIAFQLDRG